MAEISFASPPERQPKTPDSFGARIEMAAPKDAGIYQITISDEAWIDVIQSGVRVKSQAFTGKKGCPGLRKSVRFALAATPLTIPISGAQAERLHLSIAPATEH